MKSILVSGGTRGIGQSIAENFKQEKYIVFAPGSKDMDVRSKEKIDQYFTENRISELDILVCNAGIYETGDFLKQSEEDWQKTFDINVLGVMRLCQKAIPLIKEGGRIIIISSISAEGESQAIDYSASKSALKGLTRSLALYSASRSINVNAIAPGWVKTDMALHELNSTEKQTNALASTLQNRWIETSEIASLVGYLASEQAKAITGQLINIGAGIDI